MDKIDTKALVGIMQQIDAGYKDYKGIYADHRGKGCKAYARIRWMGKKTMELLGGTKKCLNVMFAEKNMRHP